LSGVQGGEEYLRGWVRGWFSVFWRADLGFDSFVTGEGFEEGGCGGAGDGAELGFGLGEGLGFEGVLEGDWGVG
jgi:hypothetical protein